MRPNSEEMRMIQDFVVDEHGATSIEYALIATIFAIVCVGAVTTLGDNVSVMWFKIGSSLAP
jgi:pilus assembly protein Flp/PilA